MFSVPSPAAKAVLSTSRGPVGGLVLKGVGKLVMYRVYEVTKGLQYPVWCSVGPQYPVWCFAGPQCPVRLFAGLCRVVGSFAGP